jgi:succinyl-diaminopimelate desuccinylase
VLFRSLLVLAAGAKAIERELDELAKLGKKHNLPVMWDLGSGSFVDLQAYGAGSEPTVQQAVHEIMGRSPQLSTTGGTSDGRFIAPTGAQVVELGVINATIHKVNECVRVEDVDTLSLAYERIMELLLA